MALKTKKMAQLPESPPQTDGALARTDGRTSQLTALLAILLPGLGKFIFMDWLELRLPHIMATVLFWGAWVAVRVIQEKEILGSGDSGGTHFGGA